MRRRLPLMAVPGSPPTARVSSASRDGSGIRLRLPGRTLGLADTGDGLAAARFAIELAAAATSIGGAVAIVWVAFDAVPVLPEVLARAHAGLALPITAFAIETAAPALPPALSLAPDALALWVGVPAVTVFAPELALLLGTDRPLSGWPAELRADRARYQLELSQNRPGLPQALASALNDHGFLPRRTHGVGL